MEAGTWVPTLTKMRRRERQLRGTAIIRHRCVLSRGCLGMSFLYRLVRPGEQPKSGGIGSWVIRRAQFCFPTAGGQDLRHNVQIGHCTVGRGAVAGGYRVFRPMNYTHCLGLDSCWGSDTGSMGLPGTWV